MKKLRFIFMSTLISFREFESSQGHALISLQITPLCHAKGLNLTSSLLDRPLRREPNFENAKTFLILLASKLKSMLRRRNRQFGHILLSREQ